MRPQDRRSNRSADHVPRLSIAGGCHGDDATAALVAYWAGLRRAAGGGVPFRSDIRPDALGALLPDAFIAARIAPGVARLRVAGRRLCDLLGMDLRGMPLSALVLPDQRDDMAGLLADLFDAPAALALRVSAPPGLMRPALTGQLTMLPLRDDEGDVTRVLGCLVTRGRIGRAPRRFALTGRHVIPLPAMPARPAGRVRSQSPQQGGAAPCPASTRPNLRLVPNDAG